MRYDCSYCKFRQTINWDRVIRDHGRPTTQCINCGKTMWLGPENVSTDNMPTESVSAALEPAFENLLAEQNAKAPVVRAPITASSVCETAAALVSGDRRPAHTDPLINFAQIAELWNALLRAKARQDRSPPTTSLDLPGFPPLTPLDVANMMEAFKIARRYCGSYNPDNFIDGAGYAGCAGEIAAREEEHTAALDRALAGMHHEVPVAAPDRDTTRHAVPLR